MKVWTRTFLMKYPQSWEKHKAATGLHIPGGNGHPSVSERKLAALAYDRDMQRQRADHVTAMLAVAIVQAGGEITVTMKDLALVYDISAAKTEDDSAIVWTAKERPVTPALVTV